MGAAKRFRERIKSQRKEQREALYGKLVGPNVGLQDFIKTAMQQDFLQRGKIHGLDTEDQSQ
ncbi:hypothetical protein Arash_gp90c [Salmonella phage Arash]|nr:hypothetical protein Arash_gp90c [Salmonella phage Arash]